MEDITGIFELFSDVSGPCPLGCDGMKSDHAESELESTVNHMLSEHGCRLIHVGQFSRRDPEGKLVQVTTAIVGVPEA